MLEGADVAAFAADDAALHVVGGQLDDADRRLGGVAGGEALHDDGEDVAHAPVGVALGLLLDLADEAGGIVTDLVLELLEQELLGLGGGVAGRALERFDVALVGFGGLLLAAGERLRLGLELGGARVQRRFTADEALLETADLLPVLQGGVVRLLRGGDRRLGAARRAGCGVRGAAGGDEPGGPFHQEQRRDH